MASLPPGALGALVERGAIRQGRLVVRVQIPSGYCAADNVGHGVSVIISTTPPDSGGIAEHDRLSGRGKPGQSNADISPRAARKATAGRVCVVIEPVPVVNTIAVAEAVDLWVAAVVVVAVRAKEHGVRLDIRHDQGRDRIALTAENGLHLVRRSRIVIVLLVLDQRQADLLEVARALSLPSLFASRSEHREQYCG